MFALSDARDYSFSKEPYLEWQEKITDQSNFVKITDQSNFKQRDVILLHVPTSAWKKMADKRGKTPESRESFQKLRPGILPKHWAGYCCLTTRAKRNIMKPFDALATSWSCHFKKRWLVDPLNSKLILQIGF